jgi:ABC-type phosphate transport system substrate-binding protein
MDAPSTLRRCAVAALAALTATSVAAPSLAAPCSSLPSPIYGIGGSAPNQLFAKLGKALSAANPPVTIVYQSPGACFGPDAILNGTLIKGTANYWDATGTQQSCDLPITGQAADFGAGSNYPALCQGFPATPPSTFGDFLGPIEAFDFLVPKASNETTISAAAAYFVYGFGTQGQAAPWTDETVILKRDQNSAAAILVSLAIGVPVAKFKGVDAKSNGQTVALLGAATNVQGAIGFASHETAEANLSTVKILAYQHYGQSCGYWPNATSTSLEKQNVRNGHYPLWGNLHFFATVDAQGKPVNPNAAKLIGWFNHTVAAPTGVDVDQISVKVGTILDCAMEVKRTSDFGELTSYAPAEPCGCYFEATATGSTTCTACTSDNDCPASATHCRKGYCEVN